MSSSFECRICFGVAGERIVARELLLGTLERFFYYRCIDCGCLQIATVPSNLSQYYPANYYSLAGADDVLLPGWLATMALDDLVPEILEAFLGLRPVDDLVWAIRADAARRARKHYLRKLDLDPNLVVLEVGCGAGAFLSELQRLGSKYLQGADPYLPSGVATQVPVHRGPLADLNGLFDIIAFHHSFEHLSDPSSVLRWARARLNEGGSLVLRLPVVDGAGWDRWGSNWAGLEAPRHLYLHSRRSLEILASQSGLHITDWERDSNSLEWIVSAQHAEGISTLSPSSVWTAGEPRFTRGRLRRLRAAWAEAMVTLGPDQVLVRMSKRIE